MNRKLKSIIALMLALAMCLAVVAGCGQTPATEEGGAATEEGGEGTAVEPGTRADGKSYLEYEVIVAGDGVGDHPAYAVLTGAQEAFASIGITLNINDPADSNVLWDALDAGTQDFWTAAWQSTIDPDMYQVYHSSGIVGAGGSDSNHYHIASDLLDQLVVEARQSDDQAYRKSIYKQALDEIVDWAVELPTYQRQNCTIFSTERVKVETITPDITTFWSWMQDIQNIEMMNADDPMVVAYSPFSQKFSPFFCDTGYDRDATDMTQLVPLTTDRVGGIIYNAIEGETVSYNGTDYLYTGPADISVAYDEATDTTTYTCKLRDDIVFSDGEPLTADDMIFNYYVYLDPSYVGSSTLGSYDIVGLNEYKQQALDVYSKYETIFDAIYTAGEGYTATDADPFTQEQYDQAWADLATEWKADVQAIVDYCFTNYLIGYGEAVLGKTIEEINASEGLQTAFGMAMWGFGEIGEDGSLTAPSGATWNLVDSFPTVDDYYAEAYAAYGGDAQAYSDVEPADGTGVVDAVKAAFVQALAASDTELTESAVANISGITKVDDYTVQVVTNGYEAPAIYSLMGFEIAPMHYYGDPDQYDYENNQFGHPYGDISVVKSVTTKPMGAGAYKFVEYSNKVIYFEANESYYKGAPKTQYIQFMETASSEVAAGVAAGTVDAGEMTGSKAYFEQVRSYNDNGELSGSVVTTNRVDNLGYGYLGANADTINVAGEPSSDASKYLRKALMTVFAVYRDVAIDSYYGDAASVINYPISNTSWAAPQPTDSDYQIAFSVDVEGNPIYTAEMTQEERYAAALQASLGFFEAAGFTVENGMVVAGPAA